MATYRRPGILPYRRSYAAFAILDRHARESSRGREFSSDLQIDAVTRAIECAPGATPSTELSDKMYPNLRVLTLQGTYQRWAQLIPRHLVELNLKHLPRNRRPTFNQLKVFLL
ncbi:hypothetical protein C8R42DRAFT_264207 [Lentinula raphanica]|nr:hypothetical protein C8R42DRAFT_264207 [Lentinula raphanica]